MNKKIKKVVGLLIGGLLSSILVIGLFSLLNCFIDWVCVNNNRYIIGIIVIGCIIYKMIKRELDR